MADKTKTAHETAIELVKAIRAELDAQKLAKSAPAKTEYTPQQAAQALGAAVRQQIKDYEAELVKMRQREHEDLQKSLYGMPSSTPSEAQNASMEKGFGAAPAAPASARKPSAGPGIPPIQGKVPEKVPPKMNAAFPSMNGPAPTNHQPFHDATAAHTQHFGGKSPVLNPAPKVMGKAEIYMDPANSNNPEKRDVTVGGKGSVLPLDKKPKVVSADGSGGDVSKEKALGKEALPDTAAKGTKKPVDPTSTVPAMPKAPALKPAGIPGAKAGAAPTVPAIPKAPGATGSTQKAEMDPKKKTKPMNSVFKNLMCSDEKNKP